MKQTKKGIRIGMVVSALAVLVAVVAAGCALNRDTVRVTDAVSGLPVQGAQVVVMYPSFNIPPYTTDRNGIARIGGFGLPQGGEGVEVSAVGYQTNFVGTYPTANHPGWRGHHMDIL